MTVTDAFQTKNTSYSSRKFPKDLEVYEKYFSSFKENKTNINLLEIGVQGGGSLYAWKNYFGDRANNIVGIDFLNFKGKEDPTQNIYIEQGDQADVEFLLKVNDLYGPFDIIIDDGGHHMFQHQKSLNTLFPLLKSEGIYAIEDLHTCYWGKFQGDLNPVFKDDNTLNALVKKIDSLNFRAKVEAGSTLSYNDATLWDKTLYGISLYESLVILQKRDKPYYNKLMSSTTY